MHRAFYMARPETGAVVHLHSTMATAVSCLPDVNTDNPIPPLTPYFVMRVGRRMPLVPYYRPGDPAMEPAINAAARDARAVLLANHGPVVSGKTLTDAVYAGEELGRSRQGVSAAAWCVATAADRAGGGRTSTENLLARFAGEVGHAIAARVGPLAPVSWAALDSLSRE